MLRAWAGCAGCTCKARERSAAREQRGEMRDVQRTHKATSEDKKQRAVARATAAAKRTLLPARTLRIVASASILPLLYVVITDWKLKRGRWHTAWENRTRAKMDADQRQEGRRRAAMAACRSRGGCVLETHATGTSAGSTEPPADVPVERRGACSARSPEDEGRDCAVARCMRGGNRREDAK